MFESVLIAEVKDQAEGRTRYVISVMIVIGPLVL